MLQTVVTRTLLATGAAGVVILNLPELHASAAPESTRPPTSKLPIYDTPPAPKLETTASQTTSSPLALLGFGSNDSPTAAPRPTPTERLAEKIGIGRRFIEAHIRVLQRKTDEVVDTLHEKERAVVDTVASLAPSKDSPERVLPGVTYSLIAGMSASILLRRRNILLRGSIPVIVTLCAARVFVPETLGKVGGLVWEWEGRVEGLQERQTEVWNGLKGAWEGVEGGVKEGRRKVENVVGGVVRGIEEVVKRG